MPRKAAVTNNVNTELNDAIEIEEIIEDKEEDKESKEPINKKIKIQEKLLNNKPENPKAVFEGDYYWLDAIEQGIRTRGSRIADVIPNQLMLDPDLFDCVLHFSLYSPRIGYIRVHFDDLFVEYFFDNLFKELNFNNEQSRIIFVKSINDIKGKLSTRKLKNTFNDIPEDVLIELIKNNTDIIEKIKADKL